MTIAVEPIQSTYPDSDGKPMAESDYQRPYIAYGTEVLSIYFANQHDVYVSGNLLIYYEEGNPKAKVAPDVFVVKGRPQGKRTSYKVWQENHQYPDFILEITSKSTVSEDQGVKRGLYAYWGVAEYFQYDPSADYLEPALQGYQLLDSNYFPMPATALSDGGLSLTSHVLGLELRLEQGELRFYRLDTQEKLLSHAESEAARLLEQNKAERLAAKLQELGIDPNQV